MSGSNENVRNSDEAAAKHSKTDDEDAEEVEGSLGRGKRRIVEPCLRTSSWVVAEVN